MRYLSLLSSLHPYPCPWMQAHICSLLAWTQNPHVSILFYTLHTDLSFFILLQLEMEDGDEIDAMLHQTGGM